MKNAKHVLRNLPVFAVLAFTFISCNENGKEKPQQEDSKENKVSDHIISIQDARAIYENYTDFRVPEIVRYETEQRAPEQKFEAARFVDFDYQMIKDYIDYVDKEAKKAGVKKVSKLRMYFANYPNEVKFEDGKDVVHPRQNSIFLLPTMAADGGNFGFYIDKNGKAQLIKDMRFNSDDGAGKSKANVIPSFNTSIYNSKSLILNRSGSGPPPFGDF